MCGRVIQSSGPLRYGFVDGMNVRDSRVHNYPPRWNAAPSQELGKRMTSISLELNQTRRCPVGGPPATAKRLRRGPAPITGEVVTYFQSDSSRTDSPVRVRHAQPSSRSLGG